MISQIADHYLIEEKIAEGAFAVVYKGRDIRLNRIVAIKVLRDNRLNGGNSWGRLLAEGRAASALNHPNICKIYDIGEEQNLDFVVLEMVEGQTLKTILRSGALPTTAALRTGLQVTEALAHAHSGGILHRDLTSSNVILTPAGNVKVIDFGLAKPIGEEEISEAKKSHSSVEEAGWLGGTLPYMAPEVLHGEAATVQSDIWSLGVLLYEMLSGDLPFVGRTLFELSMSIMVGKMEPLPRPMLPGLRGIVRRCLTEDKTARYQSAFAVYRHLQAELASVEIAGTLFKCNFSRKRWAGSRALASLLSFLGSLLGIEYFLT